MSFLCKQEKFFWAKNLPSTEHISPGFYISQSVKRKLRKNYAPFGSNVQKGTKQEFDYIPLNHSNNIYFFNNNNNNKILIHNKYNQKLKDRNEAKILKNIENIFRGEVNKKILMINDNKGDNLNKGKFKKNLKLIIDSNNKQNTYYNTINNINCVICTKENKTNDNFYDKNKKKINKLEDIIKENKEKYDIDSDKTKFSKTITENFYSRIRTKYNNELLLEFERDRNLNKNAFISSIPNKSHSYGYIIEKNGRMTPKENPDSLKIFSGLGKDTVGPGNYDINLKWNKTISLWSKSKTKRFSTKKRKNENEKKEFENNMIEKDKFSKTYTSIDRINKNKNKFNSKFNLKTLSLVGTKHALMTPNGEIITKSYNKPGRTDCFFINKLNVLYPGPGYYYEDDKWSSLKIVRIPIKKKKKYNFGSNVDRFEISNDFDSDDEIENPKEAYRKKLKELKSKAPLPTTYFKEDLKKTNYLKEKFKCKQKAFYFKHIW